MFLPGRVLRIKDDATGKIKKYTFVAFGHGYVEPCLCWCHVDLYMFSVADIQDAVTAYGLG
jgi:hypothetical protein